MGGDISLEMPTDLRRDYTSATALDLDSPALNQRPHHGGGITKLTVNFPSSNKPPPDNVSSRNPSRWRTPEFYFYAVVFVVVVLIMFWIPMRLSSGTYQILSISPSPY